MKQIIFLTTAAALAANLAAPAVAAPAIDPVVSEAVSFADLNLTSKSDQARLERRVHLAVAGMCPGNDRASPAPPLPDPECFEATMKKVRPQMDRAIARANVGEALAAAKQVDAPR
jgi:UrcA family protein